MKPPVEKKSPVPTKSEVVTIRLDPKKRFGLELLARKQYRSTSSVIEWMLDNVLSSGEYIANFDEIWDVTDADRLVNMAFGEPNLLNYEEQLIWKVITNTGYFWKGAHNSSGQWAWNVTRSSLIIERVRSFYEEIMAVASGQATSDILPKSTVKPPTIAAAVKPAPTNFDLDDDIPF